MMISPESYVEGLKNAVYPELMKERDRLIRSMRAYEKKKISGSFSPEEWNVCPGPDVIYGMDLEYLGALCVFMSERYKELYVWEDGCLRDDAAEYEAKKKRK